MLKKYPFLIVILTCFTLYSCIEYKDVEVIDVSDIRVKSLTTSVVEIEFKMQVNNPNNYKISVVDSDLELFINHDSTSVNLSSGSELTTVVDIDSGKQDQDVGDYTFSWDGDATLSAGSYLVTVKLTVESI